MRSAVQIEDVQRYWDARPCNIRHGTAEPGTPFWSEQVSARKYFVEPHIPGFAQFPTWNGKRVLEVGCGLGTDTLEFAKAGAYVDAVDLSSESIKLASKRIATLWDPAAVKLFCLNAEESMPQQFYDLIYAFGVLHHTPHPGKMLTRMRWRMMESSELRIMLYAKWSIKNLTRQQPEAQAGCPLARTYSARQARKLLESAGFVVQEIRKTHIFPWRVKDYVQYHYVKEWYYRWMPPWLFSWLERRLGWHLLIVARVK
jgi:SAM-dependent methyltransferase